MRQFRKEHPGALPPVLGRMKAIIVPRDLSPNPVAESRVTAALALGQRTRTTCSVSRAALTQRGLDTCTNAVGETYGRG